MNNKIDEEIKERRRLVMSKIHFSIPYYMTELSPETVKEKLETRSGREELRELLGDLARDAEIMKNHIDFIH